MKMQLGRWFFLAAPLLLLGCPGKLECPECWDEGAQRPQGCFYDIIYAKGCASKSCHIDTCAPGDDPVACAPAANLKLNWEDLGDGSKLVGKSAEGAFACGPKDAGGTGTELSIIDPATPEDSLLYKKLDQADPVCGARMPFAPRPELSAADKQCILDWIKQVPGVAGAPARDGG